MDDTPRDPPQKPPPLPARVRPLRSERELALEIELRATRTQLDEQRTLVELLRQQLKLQDDPKQEDTVPGLPPPPAQEPSGSPALLPAPDAQPQLDARSLLARRARRGALLLLALALCVGAERLGSRYPGLVDQLKPIVALLQRAAEVLP